MGRLLKLASYAAAVALVHCSSSNFGGANGSKPAAKAADATAAPQSSGSPKAAAPTPEPTPPASPGPAAPNPGPNPATPGPTAPTPPPATIPTAPGFPIGTISVPTATAPSYSNTGSQLYSFDPTQGAPVLIGSFTLNGTPATDIYDIAIDMAGHLFAVSPSELYVVNPLTAQLTSLLSHNVSNANGLTCLSTGAIVIAGASVDYIDPTTLAEVNLVPAGKYTSSGDIIALPDHNLYWTVDGSAFGGDQLIIVNPTTGATSVAGSTGASVWGLGYAGGVLYGFVSNGDIVSLNPATGAVISKVQSTGDAWDGATTNPIKW